MAVHKYTITYSEFRIHEVDVEVDSDDMDFDAETDMEEALELQAVELADKVLVDGDEALVRTGLVSLDTHSVVRLEK